MATPENTRVTLDLNGCSQEAANQYALDAAVTTFLASLLEAGIIQGSTWTKCPFPFDPNVSNS